MTISGLSTPLLGSSREINSSHSLEETQPPILTPTKGDVSKPNMDFDFTWEELGYSSEKIVPLEVNGEIANLDYALLLSKLDFGRDIEVGFGRKLNPISVDFSFYERAKNSHYNIKIKELFNKETGNWLDAYIIKGNNPRFFYSDGTLYWRLMYAKLDNDDCFFSPYGLLTLKDGDNHYSFYSKDELSEISPSLYPEIEKGFTFLDITGQTTGCRCNFYSFKEKYFSVD